MSTKKEIKKYVEENLKRGYSKDQIKNALLKSYPEKFVNSLIIELPEPKLFEKYKTLNTLLIILLTLRLLGELLNVYGIISKEGINPIYLIWPILYISLIYGIVKGRGWSYPSTIILILIQFKSFFGDLLPVVGVIAVLVGFSPIPIGSSLKEGILILIFGSWDIITFILSIILSAILWKNIHPDYRFKNLFTT